MIATALPIRPLTLAASRTKWNFLNFEPGLVGGHCIGVDPYYLSHLAQQLGHDPQVILAGRDTNDEMGAWIADQLHERRPKAGRALILGLTFKENVPDLRNSRSFDVARRLQSLGYRVEVADPLVSPDQLGDEFAFSTTDAGTEPYDIVVAAVTHEAYRNWTDEKIGALIAPGGTLADLKGMWRDRNLGPSLDRWTL